MTGRNEPCRVLGVETFDWTLVGCVERVKGRNLRGRGSGMELRALAGCWLLLPPGTWDATFDPTIVVKDDDP